MPKQQKTAFLENVESLVGWCHVVGIEKLSLYDTQGILYSCSQKIRDIVHMHYPAGTDTSDSEVEFPLTPPLSDCSRPISPMNISEDPPFLTIHLPPENHSRTMHGDLKRRRKIATKHKDSLTIYLLSSKSSKESIASVARSLALAHQGDHPEQFSLSVNALSSRIEAGRDGLPPPDFMIVHPLSPSTYHRAPLELYGFPPWQIRLTEVYLNRYHKRHKTWLTRLLTSRSRAGQPSLAFTELEFRQALDEFAESTQRFGR